MHHAYLLFNMRGDFFDALCLEQIRSGQFLIWELSEDTDMAYCGGGPI